MNSVKLNKKHLFSILITLVLLFSLNLNTFATSGVYSFYDYDFLAYAHVNGNTLNVTNYVTKKISNNTAPNNRLYTTYSFSFSNTASYMSVNTGVQLDMYSITEYEYDFQFKIIDSDHTSTVNITLFVDDSADTGDTIVQLYNNASLPGGEWVTVSGKFKTPDIVGTAQYVILVQIGDNDGTYTTLINNLFSISDISITPVGPLYGEHIDTPDSTDLENSIDEYEDVMSQLPTINGDELDNLMNFDFSSFTDGLAFVRDMFNRTMSVFGFNAVLVFALTIGLATYIVGRKVG